ncbi:hypothetical protein CP533_5785 [Ophiocordyceps camponoti-saundersi (nom. inval.)]|nr:hypothetical protein CP533_5785 [Ophiocordyceps camponoti-saundersi (nom. inval.)]
MGQTRFSSLLLTQLPRLVLIADVPLLDVVVLEPSSLPRRPPPEAGDEQVASQRPEAELGQTHEGEDDEERRPPGRVAAPGFAEAVTYGVGTREGRVVDGVQEGYPREPAAGGDEEAGQDGGWLVTLVAGPGRDHAVACPHAVPDRQALDDGHGHPAQVLGHVESQPALAVDVKLRHDEQRLGAQILLQDAHADGAEAGEERVEDGQAHPVVQRGAAVAVASLVYGRRQIEEHLLPKGAEDELGRPHVVPPTVDEDEPLKEAELGDGVVGHARRLETLLAGDADADVALLDHGEVVGAVADGQRQAAPVFVLVRAQTRAHGSD